MAGGTKKKLTGLEWKIMENPSKIGGFGATPHGFSESRPWTNAVDPPWGAGRTVTFRPSIS